VLGHRPGQFLDFRDGGDWSFCGPFSSRTIHFARRGENEAIDHRRAHDGGEKSVGLGRGGGVSPSNASVPTSDLRWSKLRQG